MIDKNEVIIFKDDNLELEVTVSPYMNNELDENATSKESLVVQLLGNREAIRKTKVFNLDMIISVGYRVNSKRGITFRRWANNVLREYIIEGFVVDTKRIVYYKVKHLISY